MKQQLVFLLLLVCLASSAFPRMRQKPRGVL